MNLLELQQLCKQGEGQYLEFKQYATEPDQVVEEVSGFLNSTGGSLLIGIKDDGTITGLKFAEDDLVFLLDYIAKQVWPKPIIKHELIQVNRKRSVINFTLKPGTRKPYGIVGSDRKSKKVFYRVGDQCIKASRELKNILHSTKKPDGQTIIYTAIEADILKQIDKEHRATKVSLVESLPYNSRKVSDCLVRLVVAGVIKINPQESGDFYEFNQIS